jgi:glucose-1-phosphate cytidylyltransferase
MKPADHTTMEGMKAVILAGGVGSRLQEETVSRPKPMVEIGGRPILWHIMKLYDHYGITDFIICLGYRGYQIKEYFANYVLHGSDVTVDIQERTVEYHGTTAEPWRVTLVDTGAHTMTGGRLKRVAPYVEDERDFLMTYGDGVADVNLRATVETHREAGRQATMTVVKPPGRFGAVQLNGAAVDRFVEKPQGDGGYINGGFFVLDPSVLSLIAGDETGWEQAPLEDLAARGELTAYRHDGFWLPMDTARDRTVLEQLWASGAPPWKLWT